MRGLPLAVSVAFVAVLGLGGCQSGKKVAKFVNAPPPQNYFSGEPIGIPIRRVAMLPLHSSRFPQEQLRELDQVFSAELTKKSIFEVVQVPRTRMEEFFGQRQVASVEELPAHLLERMREAYGVDGVLFMDLTHYSPYRPLSAGVRAKLVDAQSGEIRWAFDYLFDTGNPAMAQAAKTFQTRFSQEGQPLPNDGGTVLISPSRFNKFVANQTFVSLTNQ